MKKNKIIFTIIAIVIIIAVLITAGIFFLKPVSRIEKRINKEIALNMQANNQDWEIVLEDLHYEFPDELRGRAYLRNARHDVLIVVDKIVLYPRLKTLLSRTQYFQMRGDALGGTFSGDFAVGAKDDFNLVFNKLSSSHIKELSTGQSPINEMELTVSGTLSIIEQAVKADANIDSIKVTLPEPFSLAGSLYFYDGKLNFEIVDNVFTLHQALIKSEDAQVTISGTSVSTGPDSHILDFKGVLEISNPALARLLNLNQNNSRQTPRFSFSLTGRGDAPEFKFIPPEDDAPPEI